MKTQIERHIVESDSSSRTYVVSKYDDGSWACSCPSWIFKRGEKIDCKHIISLKNMNTEYYVNVTGLNKEDLNLSFKQQKENDY